MKTELDYLRMHFGAPKDVGFREVAPNSDTVTYALKRGGWAQTENHDVHLNTVAVPMAPNQWRHIKAAYVPIINTIYYRELTFMELEKGKS